MADKDLARIAALLRKAEGTDNQHEADAFLQAAQRLATLAAVDLAVARAHTSKTERRATPTQRTITIGDAGKRGLRTYVELFLAIGRANNVTCDIARDSTRVYAYGFDTDIDTAEAIYSSLVVQMVRASDAYIKSGEYAREWVMKQVRTPTSGRRRWSEQTANQYELVEKPVHPSTARINFQQAFAVRIGKRLASARRQAEQQALRREAVGASSAGAAPASGVAVVLRARELELADHYRANSTARGTWSGSRATAGHSALARQAGDRAGRRARLGSEREIGGSRPALGS
jgi:hypothetical protein